MKKYLYCLAVLLTVVFWYACTPPLEGVILKLPVAITNSNVIVQYRADNQNAGDLPSDLKVSIAGADSLKVVDIIGGRNFRVKQNVLSLAASPETTPSSSSPIKFTLVTEAEGYLKNITPVQINSTSDQNLTISLTKIASPPTGITAIQQTAALSNEGLVNTAISVTTPLNNNITEKASLAIPTGISMKDGNGATVGGNIDIVMTKADATKTGVSVNSNAMSKVVDKNNNVIPDFNMKPIVGLKIEISNDLHQKVKSFSGFVTIKTEIPSGAIDPLTNKVLKEGDAIVITSFDEDSRVFKYEGKAQLIKNTSGKLEAVGSINHLTQIYFAALNSIFIEIPSTATTAEKNALIAQAEQTFATKLSANQIKIMKDYYISLVGSDLEQYTNEVLLLALNGVNVAGTTSRSNIKITTPDNITSIAVKDRLGNSLLTINNPVFSTDAKLSVTLPSAPNYVKLIANLSCPAPKKTNADNIQMYAKTLGAKADQYFYLGKALKGEDGIIRGSSILLKRGGKYDFKFIVGATSFYYDNQTVTNGSEHKITSSMPSVLCE